MRVTDIAEAWQAKRVPSSNDMFSERATAKAPQNVSPAAVVSTASTLSDGTTVISWFAIMAPREPRVTITFLQPAS